MSKLDAVRALREARFNQDQARAGKPASRPKNVAAKATKQPAVAPPVEGEDDEALCGHRNMSGKTCTRERGHAAKNHRYS